MLYLQSMPMTEPSSSPASAGCCARYGLVSAAQSDVAVLAAAVVLQRRSLTRYEGWFLIPFVAVYFLFARSGDCLRALRVRLRSLALGPLAWLAHNRWYYGERAGVL